MARLEETPYDDAEHAFFAMVDMQRLKADGFQPRANQGLYNRPGNGRDVEIAITRLFRNRLLTVEHIQVLRFYGRRGLPPDPRRVKEARSAALWKEAMDRIGTALVRKGMIREQRGFHDQTE